MLILSPEEALPGMVLAAPVPQPHNPSQDLLKRGCVLDATILARLREMNVPSVYLDFPGLEDLDRHLSPVFSPPRRKAFELIHSTFDHSQRNPRFVADFASIYANARDLILTLTAQGQGQIYLDNTFSVAPDHSRHCAAVAHLSLLLGLKLENYLIRQRHRLPVSHARDIVNLGVAAMLHDIGKTRLSPTLASFHTAAPPSDPGAFAEWQEHSRLGYEYLKSGVEPSAAAAVLHHHQSFDGKGFPRLTLPAGKVIRFAGTRIHVFARILAAADVFDRLATATEPKRRLTNLEALHLLRTRHADQIDGVLIHALHSLTPPFQPGTVVGLSDKCRAVVIRFADEDPFRPTVRKLGPTLQEFASDELDLRLTPSLTITHVGPISNPIPTRGLTTSPDTLKAFSENTIAQIAAA